MADPTVQTRTLGKCGVTIPVLSMGGHAFIWDGAPDAALGGQILGYLLDHGVTHFDVTYRRERQAYRAATDAAGLTGRLQPIVWHMDHGHPNTSADEVIRSFRFELAELGCERAALAVFEGGPETPDWFYRALDRLKQDGLVQAVGLDVLNRAPDKELYLYGRTYPWDFITPYWSYSLRRSQFLVEWAREQGVGVYTVGPLGRGAFLKWPGVTPAEFVRPWLKWILREPAVAGFAMTLATLDQARLAVAACDASPMSTDDVLYLHRMNFPVQLPNYHLVDGAAVMQDFEVFVPETHGSNMFKRDMVRWRPVRG